MLHNETNSWQPMQVNNDQLEPLCLKEVSTTDPCFKQLAPGDSVSWYANLPSVYFNNTRASEERYKIFWRGGQIHLWDWGTLTEHSALHHQLVPKSPAVVLPSGPQCCFGVVEDETDLEDDVGVWSDSPAPMSPSTQMNDAPVFNVNIAGPATLSVKDRSHLARLHYPVRVTVSYDAVPELVNDRRPITFHTSLFEALDSHNDGFRLYIQDKDEWTGHEINGLRQHHAYRFSTPEPVKVGNNNLNQFQSLMPGESWSFTRQVSDFPKTFAPGNQFRYGFKGITLDWWDWGDLHDHGNTVVWIREDRLHAPKDNGGRPEIKVPASNWLKFKLVE